MGQHVLGTDRHFAAAARRIDHILRHRIARRVAAQRFDAFAGDDGGHEERRHRIGIVTLNRPQALNALMISRNLERVADHATNIAEDVIYMVQAEVVKHHPEKL